jgi:hypothetical protein
MLERSGVQVVKQHLLDLLLHLPIRVHPEHTQVG